MLSSSSLGRTAHQHRNPVRLSKYARLQLVLTSVLGEHQIFGPGLYDTGPGRDDPEVWSEAISSRLHLAVQHIPGNVDGRG